MNSPGKENIYRFKNERPRLGARVFIDRFARVSRSVELGGDHDQWGRELHQVLYLEEQG